MKLKDKKTVYTGFHDLEVRTYEDVDKGITMQREVMTSKDACASFIYHRDRKQFAFVKQFRGGSGSFVTECVAGMMDGGETPSETIRREIKEETGCDVVKTKLVNYVHQGPATIEGVIYLFLCIVDGYGLPRPDDGENLEIDWVDILKLPFIKFHDMKTLSLLYEFNKRKEFFNLD